MLGGDTARCDEVDADMNRLCDVLEIDLPILQAPMAGHQDADLAMAVAAVGGLGALPCATLDGDTMQRELERFQAGSAGPVNVNFFCHEAPRRDAAEEGSWSQRLAPYFAECDLPLPEIPTEPLRRAFDDVAADRLEPFRPAVVSFHFGLPPRRLLERVKGWGAKVLASATTVNEARWLEAHGADAIIAQGLEAGGHRGMFLSTDVSTQVGTLALLPQVAAAVSVPVIAAGGIADAAGVAAVLALGAQGVQVGTAYLFCPEARISDLHRRALGSEDAAHTALTNLFTGRPARGIVNGMMRELGAMRADVPAFPMAASWVAPLRRAAEAEGRPDFTPLWSGQNAGACRAMSAADLTRELAAAL